MDTKVLQWSIVKGAHRPDLIRDESLADMYRATAQQYPNKVALIFGTQQLTYSELDRWSDAIAMQLASLGIGSGHTVGLWWQRGLELHAAILGIVKSGAGYVPLDADMPAERVATVLTEVGASAYYSPKTLDVGATPLAIPAAPSSSDILTLPLGPQPDDWAYILYTSGSTGKPKGIPITHRQICHLVRSEHSLLQINDTDKVYQGFSVSFDMWCEEVWVSYLAGATVWVADGATAKSIDELSDLLRAQQITILHAVPSLLAIMDDVIPTLRLVNAGGEACTPQVLAKWGTAGRIFYNSYGPTETTVSATFAPLKAGDKITIGAPLPNYHLAVVDEQMNPLPCGEKGELIITGPGVCNGYVNRPDLTAEKFITKPASLANMPGDRLYRSGDAAIIRADGSIDFQGRLDDQIKLRGYRIELGEIEQVLNTLTGISAAAVDVKKDPHDNEHLIGYVLPHAGSTAPDEATMRAALAKLLPPYMVPTAIVTMTEMPRLPSGKIDRKSLPIPTILLDIPKEAEIPAPSADASLSDHAMAALRGIFVGREITLDSDFFTDLGGHSLLAASFVSKLRKSTGHAKYSLKDIYLHRPLSALLAHWGKASVASEEPAPNFQAIPTARYYACWLAQTVALFLIYGLFAVQIFLPYLGYYYVQQETSHHGYGIITALVMYCFIPPILSMMSVMIKWLVIGKYKVGDYPLWGSYYFRWWLVKKVQSLVQMEFLNGTPLYPRQLRWLGVNIASDAQLSAIYIGAEDLVTIGSDASLSSNVLLNNAYVEDGLLKIREIHIGAHAYIGSSATVGAGAVMRDWSELGDLSYLPAGAIAQEGEVWRGSPAQMVERKRIEDLPHPEEVSASRQSVYFVLFSLLLLVFPFAMLLPLIPTLIALNEIDTAAADYDFGYLIYTPLFSLMYVVLFLIQSAILSRVLLRKIKPGTYSIYSRFYVWKWLCDQLMELSLFVLHPIYATVFVRGMFRAFGAKIGKNTEISTASNVTHTMLEIGEGCFIADAVTLGEADVRAQRLIVERTVIGNNSFVGNSALIPQGYTLGDNMLIGVLSVPPTAAQLQQQDAKDWFGSPAVGMPRRQESQKYDDNLTHHPTILRRLARGTVELIRVLIPQTAVISLSILFIAYGHDLIINRAIWKALLEFPIYYVGIIGLPSFLITAGMKWLLVGSYRAEQQPMWSHRVWLSEAVTATNEALSVPFLLTYLRGTPWLPIAFRLYGVKIGKRVWMDTTDITEYDMVEIGDDAALNHDCGPQTHLFEDRVMKTGTVKIGSRVSIGPKSIILYDSEVGDDVRLAPLSLVIKGEQLPAGSVWGGSPVRHLR
jgi:non-ribosomal peptide synthetase-like protein